MVHRPADSRLLINLLNHEKEYSKQLASLLDHSQASLTSFSAYASASAPPTSQIIVSIAGALFGADEAFRKYATAVDQWQQQLKALKEMEDALGNIIRDREILVTRLIKVSKHSKPPARDGIPNSSSSTLSYNGGKTPEVQIGTKLSAAQTELQACEAHLANKEKELEAFRTATIRSGLQARCKALVECGWTWSEMGKEGMRALDVFELPNGNAYSGPLPVLPTLKPLPNLSPDNPSSDHSSIAPSQSASQIGPPGAISLSSTQYTLTIGPAHSISEHAMPNGTAFHAPTRIVEEPGGSSAEEGDPHQDVEVVENERFLPSRKRRGQGAVRAHVRTVSEIAPNRHVHFPTSTSDTFLLRSPTERDFAKGKRGGSVRRGSHGVFGSIAALFSRHKSGSGEEDSPILTSGKWKTRTDRNLKKKGADSSDEEDLRLRQHLGPMGPSMSAPAMHNIPESGPGPTTSRMRKRLKRGSVQVPPRPAAVEHGEDRGWVSEGDGETLKGRKAKPQGAVNPNESDAEPPTPIGPDPSYPSTTQPKYGSLARTTSLKKSRPKMPNGGLQLVSSTPAEVSLSRNSSMSKQSVMSAPAVVPTVATQFPSLATPSPRKRISSMDRSPSSPKANPSTNLGSGKVLSGVGYPPVRTPSKTTKRAAEPGMNLMSIVEDVRKNRDIFTQQQDPDRLLVLPKAPPPVSELLELEEQRERDAKQVEENLRSIAAAQAASAPDPEPPTPTTATTTTSLPAEREERPPARPVIHSPPDKAHSVKPLRSALRTTSRSPSPAMSPSLHPVAGPSKVRTAGPLANGSAKVAEDDDNDAASISSYETGHEVFNEDDDDGDRTPSPIAPLPPPPPPPQDNKTNAHGVNSDLSNSTDSTTTDAHGGQRRTKSVRMSLPPTFSVTPPAIYEEYDGDGSGKQKAGRHEPWAPPVPSKRHPRPVQDPVPIPNGSSHTSKGGGWSSRIADTPAHKDVWEDSSDEDEEYGRAKRLLGKFSRKG